MRKIRALCVFTNLLGNKAMSTLLTKAFDSHPDVEPTYVRIDVKDYDEISVPWWARATNPWQVQHFARHKARQFMKRPFDLLLVQGWEMLGAFTVLARRIPSAAVMDSVPATIDAQLRRRGFNGWKRRVSHTVHHRAFRRAVHEFDYFLVMGSDCADALHHEYGVESDRCAVTLAPQDLEKWTPGTRNLSAPVQLLFVGNDFARKGGDFLLSLYGEHLSSTCRLTIASNDPTLENRKLPPGVQWLSGRSRDQLVDLYRNSDIFLFPTQQDYMPQVLGEALASGLPCLASDVGGIRDLVRNGETGYLVSPNASAEVWAAHLNRLIANPEEILRMSKCARKFAEEKLGLNRFEHLIAEVIKRLSEPGDLIKIGQRL
jgi:glycosyltransferase involved in cell wall biosynthesis